MAPYLTCHLIVLRLDLGTRVLAEAKKRTEAKEKERIFVGELKNIETQFSFSDY